MSRVAPNMNYNIDIQEGRDFVNKLRKLGFVMGDLFINPTGPFPFDYEPVDRDATGFANLLVFANGELHNVKMLKLTYGPGELNDLRELHALLRPMYGGTFGDFLLNIPGVSTAAAKVVKELK